MKKYPVIIEKTGSGFSAYVPDLPGCVAFGETRAETEQQIREGIAFHIRGMRQEGLSIPEPTTEALTLSVAA
jgi:predicted RNase H-like HicB family nuclease